MARGDGAAAFRLLVSLILLSIVLGVTAIALGHPTLGWWLSNGGTLATLIGFGTWVFIKTRRR